MKVFQDAHTFTEEFCNVLMYGGTGVLFTWIFAVAYFNW